MHEWHNIRLTAGKHSGPGDGLCLMEAVALFAGERHGDWPNCVCPALIEFGRVLNDALPDDRRTAMLLRLVPVLVGTREPGCTGDGLSPSPLERRRATMLVTWCVNTLPGLPVAKSSDEYDRREAYLSDAVDQLAVGQAQHATRYAANAVAWAVKGVWHRNLGDGLARATSLKRAAEQACHATLEVWQSAIDAYRSVALLGYAPAVEIALLAGQPALGLAQ